MPKLSGTYSRGRLAKVTGVKSETIRYYDQRGLLSATARTAGGHRIYSEDHVKRLQFIRRCRELGFSLGEIEGLLELDRGENKTCEQVRHATEVHLRDVQEKISDLTKMEDTLIELISQCDDLSSPTCPIIESLSGST
jgi:MerR family mercuric resistance operon transcriptional regulator